MWWLGRIAQCRKRTSHHWAYPANMVVETLLFLTRSRRCHTRVSLTYRLDSHHSFLWEGQSCRVRHLPDRHSLRTIITSKSSHRHLYPHQATWRGNTSRSWKLRKGSTSWQWRHASGETHRHWPSLNPTISYYSSTKRCPARRWYRSNLMNKTKTRSSTTTKIMNLPVQILWSQLLQSNSNKRAFPRTQRIYL